MAKSELNLENLSVEEIKKEYVKLDKKFQRLETRTERFLSQSDAQQRQMQKLNERLESYIEIVDDYVITVNIDLNMIIKDVSIAFSNTFGYKSIEVVKERYEFLLDVDENVLMQAAIAEVKETKEVWHGEVKHLRKNGNRVWTDTIITPLFDENDEVNGYNLLSQDITDHKRVESLKKDDLKNKKYDDSILEYIPSLSAATLLKASSKLSILLWVILATVLWSIIWANFAQLDEITRGAGKLIPAQQVIKLQDFEGGAVTKILVKEGDKVKKGDVLIHMSDFELTSKLDETAIKIDELRAKALRLDAEANNRSKVIVPKDLKIDAHSLESEQSLFFVNYNRLQSSLMKIDSQISQKNIEVKEANEKMQYYKNNVDLLDKEIAMKKPLYQERIISESEFLKLEREQNDLVSKYDSEVNTYNKNVKMIHELKQQRNEFELNYQSEANEQYNKVSSEIKILVSTFETLDNKIGQKQIVAPIDGTINQIHVISLGQVVQAGKDVIEIVPEDESLVARVEISPSDIGNLSIGQNVVLKINAYDFGIYGGANGKIDYISSDTILNDKGEPFYTVNVKLEKTYIGTKGIEKELKVGMELNADVITGEKSVMDYILKPIFKAKQNAMTEK